MIARSAPADLPGYSHPVPKVLVVEDDQQLARFLTRVLTEEGYAPLLVPSVREALAALEGEAPDVAIVDRMLPDGDGLAICARARELGAAVPIIVLTARGELNDRIEGLDAGADDYVIKPFEIDELLARLRAVLRRTTAPVRTAGPLKIDLRTRRILCHDQPVELTAKEFDVLAHLVDADGALLSRTALLRAVWGVDRDPGTNLVEVHVSRLRTKLGATAWTIETVRGGGYRFRRESTG
jgi:DNA-binding response OmpR family regulator